jgi:hypothetical protein
MTTHYTPTADRFAPDALLPLDLPRFVCALPYTSRTRMIDAARQTFALAFYGPALRRAVRAIEADVTARAESIAAYHAAVAEGMRDLL